jgi:hypothetical protein
MSLASTLRKHGITLKIIYIAIGVVFALLIGIIIILVLGRKKSDIPEHALDVATVIRTEHELSTLTYVYSDVGRYETEKKKIGNFEIPLTDDEFLFTYGGEIKVGFKLDDVTPVVNEAAKTITVEVPEPVVLSHTPNHNVEHAYDMKGVVLGTSAEDRFNGLDDCRDELRKDKEKLVIEDKEIQEKAIEEYKKMCTSWLLASDAAVAEYTIQFN